MVDRYDLLFENLSKGVANEDVRRLLEKLIEVQRKDGVGGMKAYLDERLEEFEGD